MKSGLESWIEAFEFDVYEVKKTPQAKSSAPTRNTLRSGAIRSSHAPKPAAPRNITRHVVREMPAETSAPSSAPAPKHALMRPKVIALPCNVDFARIGSRMLKLKLIEAKTTIITSTTRTVWLLRA